jgi:hypothetical protein
MKKLPLLPHFYQKLGFVLLIPFLALGIAVLGWDFEFSWLTYHFSVRDISLDNPSLNVHSQNFTDELASVGCIISLMLIAFSKEKTEDEAIQFFRLASLQWAVILNYIILIAGIIAIYGLGFLSVMTYNMFTILIIFVIRFRFVLFQHNKSAA